MQLTIPFREANRAVLLFARAPKAEAKVKSIGPDPEWLHESMVAAVIRAIAVLDRDVRLLLPSDQSHDLRPIVSRLAGAERSVAVMPTAGDGFGPRFRRAFTEATSAGYTPVVALMGDVPEIRPRHLRRAFGLLDQGADVVLGPALDGGFYLLGARSAPAELFRGIVWRGRQTRAQLEERARTLGVNVLTIEPLSDVDSRADLEALWDRARRREPNGPLACAIRRLTTSSAGSSGSHLAGRIAGAPAVGNVPDDREAPAWKRTSE